MKSIVGHTKDMDTFGVYGHRIIGEDPKIADSTETSLRIYSAPRWVLKRVLNKNSLIEKIDQASFSLEVRVGFEPTNGGFAGRSVTTSPSHHTGFPVKETDRKGRKINWSGRRDSNSRPSPWQGDALPLSHFRTASKKEWCLGAESNHRHEDFQSSALPTELPRRVP